MPDLFWLADLGRASTESLWLPLLAWTAVALVAEAALRLIRAGAPLALPVRGAVLTALPLAVAVPAALRWLAPEVPLPTLPVDLTTWLPGGTVGAAPGPVEAIAPAGPPLVDALLGLAVGVAVAAALVHVLRLGGALVGVVRTRRALSPADAAAQVAVDAARERLGVARPVVAAEAPVGTAPFTLGVRRPLVALPPTLDGEARALAALHEVAHVRRADAAWATAQRALAAVFAAHPLVWVLGRGLDLDRERAVDAAVLDACPDQRRAYADLLFSYAALPAPALALGTARGSSTLKTRIDAMTSPLSATATRRLSHLGKLTGLLALLAVTGIAASTAPAPPPPPAEALSAPWLTDSVLVDRVDIRRGEAGNRIDVHLKAGVSPTEAEAFAADFEDAEGPQTQEALLRVHHDGGLIERSVRMPAAALLGAPRRDGSAVDLGLEGAQAIDRVDVMRGDRGGILEITLRPGVSRATAEAIADDAARAPGARVRVVMADGTVLERAARPVETGARRDTTEVLEVVDEMPQLIGGLEGLMARVAYPELQRRAGVEGRAVVQFIVDESGAVVDPAVAVSSGNDGLDQAAVAAVRGSAFEPGRQRGEAVRVRFAVPITFRLGDGEAAAPEPGPAPEVGAGEVFEVAEQQPVLIGGLQGLMERVTYPPLAREAGTEGVVIVQFVVDEEGAVQDAAAIRSPDDMLTEAALAAVRGSRFEPGMQRGVPVKVRFAVPITFRLPAEEE